MEMANVTVAVPEELKKRMEHVPDVNWSEVARQAFEETIRRKQMLEASESIDRLRESSKTTGWNGVQEIRKWRVRDERTDTLSLPSSAKNSSLVKNRPNGPPAYTSSKTNAPP